MYLTVVVNCYYAMCDNQDDTVIKVSATSRSSAPHNAAVITQPAEQTTIEPNMEESVLWDYTGDTFNTVSEITVERKSTERTYRTELSPVLLSDNTVVKVPISSRSTTPLPTMSHDKDDNSIPTSLTELTPLRLDVNAEVFVSATSRPSQPILHAGGGNTNIPSLDASQFTCAQRCDSQVTQQDLYFHSQTDNLLFDDDDGSTGSSLQPGQSVQDPESQETTDPTQSNLDVVDTSHLNEYNRIANMLSKYSQEQFLNHILSETCSSETDLENTRAFLFEILRDSDTFPFDRNAELKRRKHTRFGESVPLKLAKDIHALISVAEGADYSELNDVLSNCKTKARSKSVSQSSAKITHTAKVCTTASDSDVKLLTEKVSCIEADMLLLKQRQIAIEVARRDEIKLLQQTVSETKSDIGKLQTVLQDQCNYLRDIFDKTLGQYASGHMQEVELYMDKVYKTVTPLYLRVEALCEHVQYAPNSKTSSPVTMAKTRTEESSTARDPDAALNMYPLIADYPPLVDTQTARDPSVNTHRHAVSSHSAKLQNLLVPDGRGKEGELTFGNIPIPTTISGQQKNAADATRAGERHPDQGKRIPTRVCGITESSHVQQQGTNPDKSSKTVTAEFPSYKDVAARQTQNQ